MDVSMEGHGAHRKTFLGYNPDAECHCKLEFLPVANSGHQFRQEPNCSLGPVLLHVGGRVGSKTAVGGVNGVDFANGNPFPSGETLYR